MRSISKKIAQGLIPVAAVVLVGGAVPAAAQNEEEAAANAEDDVNAANRIICRRMPPPVGTRIGARRICKTQLEWAQLQDEGETIVREVQVRIPLNAN